MEPAVVEGTLLCCLAELISLWAASVTMPTSSLSLLSLSVKGISLVRIISAREEIKFFINLYNFFHVNKKDKA